MLFDLIKKYLPITFKAIHGVGYQDAVKDILVFKDKIYTQPVTIEGDNLTVTNCTFLGSDVAMKIITSDITRDYGYGSSAHVTKDEFLAQFDPQTLRKKMDHRVVLPCSCGDEGCQGWAFVHDDPESISDHLLVTDASTPAAPDPSGPASPDTHGSAVPLPPKTS